MLTNTPLKKAVRITLHLAEIVFSFLEIFDFWVFENGGYSSYGTRHISDIASWIRNSDPLLATCLKTTWVVLFTSIAAIVVFYVASLIKPTLGIPKKLEIAANALPLLCLGAITGMVYSKPYYTYIGIEGSVRRYMFEINVLFIVFAAVLAVNFVLLFIPFTQPEKNRAQTPADARAEAESLTYYKELLDKGVITQEDFDAKKKQILGL